MVLTGFHFYLCAFLALFGASSGTHSKTSFATPIARGYASFYSAKFEGRRTANGEIFSHKKFTAASNRFPLNTWVKVTDDDNGKSVVVWVNDHMGVSKKSKRIIDLSKAAADKIGLRGDGLTTVTVEALGKDYEGKEARKNRKVQRRERKKSKDLKE